MKAMPVTLKKTGRNDPCPCGSGRKYKHCCQPQTTAPPRESSPAGMFEVATTHHQAGRLPQAEALCRQILQATPDHPDALHLLGLIAHQCGQHEAAADLLRAALSRQPRNATFHCNLGVVQCHLGAARQAQDQLDAARASFQRALSINPDHAEAHNNLGMLLHAQGGRREALTCFQRALSINPGYAEAHNNLGMARQYAGENDAALECYRRAIAIRPGYVEAHHNLSLLLLLRGAWREGWQEYEWRVPYRSGQTYLADPRDPARVLPRPSTQMPITLKGQRVLLVGEQGIGDELFFLRFARRAQQRGAWLACQCSHKIASLLQRAPGLDAVCSGDALPEDLDRILYVGDLPLVLGADRLDDLPPPLPLSVLPASRVAIRERLAAFGGAPLLGVTWRAGTERTSGQGKSLLFKQVDPVALGRALSAWPGEVLILQRHPRAADIADFERAFGRPAHDCSDLNDDLEGMLALLARLDEYVGVSNTNMHLMAGLGKTARVLVPHPPEWRWMAEGRDSPWFPGFRVYRQSADGDWSGALTGLADDIQPR